MNEAASGPVTLTLTMESVVPPVLVRVTSWVVLVVPIGRGVKDRLVDDRETVGRLSPVPVRMTDCGDPETLSVMVMAAESAPEDTGAK